MGGPPVAERRASSSAGARTTPKLAGLRGRGFAFSIPLSFKIPIAALTISSAELAPRPQCLHFPPSRIATSASSDFLSWYRASRTAIAAFASGDYAGAVDLLLCVGGLIRLNVECIDACLSDISEPRPAIARPAHNLGV